MTLVIGLVALVLLLAIGLIAYVRRPRQDSGLTSFRRHIDALSPESRRELQDRVRPAQGGSTEPPTEDDDDDEQDDLTEGSAD